MQLGAETVFVGSGIFKSQDPEARGRAVVEATTNFSNAKKVMESSTGLKSAMKGLGDDTSSKGRRRWSVQVG